MAPRRENCACGTWVLLEAKQMSHVPIQLPPFPNSVGSLGALGKELGITLRTGNAG